MSLFSRRRDAPAPAARGVRTLPATDTWVHLFAAEDPILARVERRGSNDFDVVVEGDGPPLEAGSVQAQWPSGNGLWVVDADVAPLSPARWRLTVTGQSEELQRRGFVRVPTSVRVMLRLPGGGMVRATSADLSETGASVIVPADVEIAVGQQLQVSLLLHNTPVAVNGEVVRAQRSIGGDMAAGVQFIPPYANDVIRRWVLATQLNERARRRED